MSIIARTPVSKLGLVVLLGVLLAIPLFFAYQLVSDRQSQSATAKENIVAGWGNQQTLSGPFLVIPFTKVGKAANSTDDKDNNATQDDSLVIAPTQLTINTLLNPELRKVSIYEAVLYTIGIRMQGNFVMPDLAKLDIKPAWVHFDQAHIATGISSTKGLAGSQPVVMINGKPLSLTPGSGLSQDSGSGFSGRLGTALSKGQSIAFDIYFQLRGHDTIAVNPSAQDTQWHVSSSWPSPSFLGGFLPVSHKITPQGFEADWRIGNFALNRPIVSVGEQQADSANQVSVTLINTVDLYSQVSRAAKYGFMFIGFTFVVLLMFDILSSVHVPGPAYLLVGMGLILFFVMLLAFSEVIGFMPAYLAASGAIVALLSCYIAAILKSWRHAIIIALMMVGLYGVLYVLLNLEAYSLLIGSLLIFAALAVVMYFTRNINWRESVETAPKS